MSNKTSGKNVENDRIIAHKFAVMQQQINEKDKRIKELEEENAMLKKADNIARDVNIEEVTEVMNKSYEEFMSNYINKQKVIDVINEYKDKIEKYNEYRIRGKETDVEYYENIANTIVVQVLQELLEGEK